MDYKVIWTDNVSNISTLILFPSTWKNTVLPIVLTDGQFSRCLSKYIHFSSNVASIEALH